MEAIPLCLFLNKPNSFIQTQHTFIVIQMLPLAVYYMFRPLCRPSSGISIKEQYKNLTKEDIITI